jgi:hypothetical protein
VSRRKINWDECETQRCSDVKLKGVPMWNSKVFQCETQRCSNVKLKGIDVPVNVEAVTKLRRKVEEMKIVSNTEVDNVTALHDTLNQNRRHCINRKHSIRWPYYCTEDVYIDPAIILSMCMLTLLLYWACACWPRYCTDHVYVNSAIVLSMCMLTLLVYWEYVCWPCYCTDHASVVILVFVTACRLCTWKFLCTAVGNQERRVSHHTRSMGESK